VSSDNGPGLAAFFITTMPEPAIDAIT